ncbi:MAG: MATE family efflux transporter [Treponema sp.]
MNFIRKNRSAQLKSAAVINRAALPMFQLTLPIIGETFFRTLVASADTLMLSSYKDSAVAAVGMMGQYIFFTQLLFNIICTGASIVLAQYIGAGRTEKAERVTKASTAMALYIGAAVTLFGIVATKPLLSMYSIEDDVRTFAAEYFIIFGGIGAFATAFNMLQGAVLRAYGYTKDALIGTIIANVINLAGNALAIYVIKNGFEVTGTAWASVASQVVSCFIYTYMIRTHAEVKMPLKGVFKFDRESYVTVLRIGIPTAGESISYNVAQIVIMAMVSTLGTASMSALVYAQTIVRYVYVLANSIGVAVQIKTGYFVGAGKSDTAYVKVYKYQLIGSCCSLAVILIINLFSTELVSLFTHDPDIISRLKILLRISIYYELGRSMNLITISALKGSGDVKFPVFYGICSMWGIMVAGSWFFGMKLGYGLTAVWWSIGSDEFSRGVVMVLRWHSKRWMSKAIS